MSNILNIYGHILTQCIIKVHAFKVLDFLTKQLELYIHEKLLENKTNIDN